MTLAELLADRAIDRAVIIDDGYDPVPTADDLSNEDAAWAVFIADIAMDHDIIDAAFPSYGDIATDELIRNDAFIAALWGLKDQLRGTSWVDLFGRYETDVHGDRTFLTNLEAALTELGIVSIQSGHIVPAEAADVPLIFIDLFLGGAQDPQAMERSVMRVRDLIAGREAAPPIVILMSRSDRLDLNKDEFRSQTELLGAMFRFCGKQELLADDTLARMLTRLVQHQPDSHKIAGFLAAWEHGLEAAKSSFLSKVRRLDLADYVQIRDLLLTFEGQPLGSYLLDIFDRVLQHEIESDAETIAAARTLASVDPTAYIAPHIAGSADLQALVYQTLFQHPARLQVPATQSGVPVGFGDILVEDIGDDNADLAKHSVLIVMTPACDVLRPACKQILLMAGTLKPLTAEAWTYSSPSTRTPVIEFSNDRRYWIDWDLKDLRTWPAAEIARSLAPVGAYTLHVRMREGPAIELQQKLLADLGRVGQVAHMPATFAVRVELHGVDQHNVWSQVPLEILDRDGGVCFYGRDENADKSVRLVLSEAACDDVLHKIQSMTPNDVPERARPALKRLKESDSFPIMLEGGLDVTRATTAFSQIVANRTEPGGNVVKEPVLLLAKNTIDRPAAQASRNAVFAIVLKDYVTDQALAQH
jgi:hypothetical protein